uniref:precorrin-6y C5,15-methyltransferase (decarboxylating) subunit CbiE n=1 Tax=Eubacterium cellulosolvens TaxID=29322 RepID=UPI0006859C1D|nr:precorrin-6y C5,15-methyltransferase (decarboxylating) subunit CbiE [[Eubacterium] cellulosolvens]
MSEIALIGIGPGNTGALTKEAALFCEQADLLIGAARMLEAVAGEGQNCFCAYQPEKILACIHEHSDAEKIAILMSGDTGFFSGAKKILPLLPADTRIIPGISSVSMFCARLRTSWDDILVTSMHGKNCNLTGLVRTNRRVFSILGKTDAVRRIAEELQYFGLNHIRVSVGEQLGYPEENITCGSVEDFLSYENHPLCVLLLENPEPETVKTHGIPDEAFIHGDVPMTKEEVREISISKLRLGESFVLYDVGAGTGSVSVEAARLDSSGCVFSIEKKAAAVELLRKNRRHFGASNMEIIEGTAPGALEDLPAPTHAFIGGSSGELRDILRLLLDKNPKIRVVINAITLETLTEALTALRELPFTDVDIACVNVSKARSVARYHMMTAHNPVYVIAADGNAEETGSTSSDTGDRFVL